MMKKVTLSINGLPGSEGAMAISSALNDLSGVVAADMAAASGQAYAYAGDRLSGKVMEDAVKGAGYDATVVKEEYLSDVRDFKKSLQ